jgi:hypothetical protein
MVGWAKRNRERREEHLRFIAGGGQYPRATWDVWATVVLAAVVYACLWWAIIAFR